MVGGERAEWLQVDPITFSSQLEKHKLRESEQLVQAEQAELGLEL